MHTGIILGAIARGTVSRNYMLHLPKPVVGMTELKEGDKVEFYQSDDSSLNGKDLGKMVVLFFVREAR